MNSSRERENTYDWISPRSSNDNRIDLVEDEEEEEEEKEQETVARCRKKGIQVAYNQKNIRTFESNEQIILWQQQSGQNMINKFIFNNQLYRKYKHEYEHLLKKTLNNLYENQQLVMKVLNHLIYDNEHQELPFKVNIANASSIVDIYKSHTFVQQSSPRIENDNKCYAFHLLVAQEYNVLHHHQEDLTTKLELIITSNMFTVLLVIVPLSFILALFLYSPSMFVIWCLGTAHSLYLAKLSMTPLLIYVVFMVLLVVEKFVLLFSFSKQAPNDFDSNSYVDCVERLAVIMQLAKLERYYYEDITTSIATTVNEGRYREANDQLNMLTSFIKHKMLAIRLRKVYIEQFQHNLMRSIEHHQDDETIQLPNESFVYIDFN
mmetsp:Transcript_12828/g.19323  ORF Transcript_12828/g.19323 Transcript_12828/m.19323 type:complete len:377 (+) Transcript_12828:170-1300(+)